MLGVPEAQKRCTQERRSRQVERRVRFQMGELSNASFHIRSAAEILVSKLDAQLSQHALNGLVGLLLEHRPQHFVAAHHLVQAGFERSNIELANQANCTR
jgi:hypothetical protein